MFESISRHLWAFLLIFKILNIMLFFYEFLSRDLVVLHLSNGAQKWIKLDDRSGRIVTRQKVDTISNIMHPGIFLGTDYYTGKVYVIHNHYKYGSAYISTFSEYASGRPVYWQAEKCTNPPREVLEIGLKHAVSKKSYHPLEYNCQTFTNTACHNKPVSEDVEKWVGIAFGVFFAGVIVSAIGK